MADKADWSDVGIDFNPAFIALSKNANYAYSGYDRKKDKLLATEIEMMGDFASEFLRFIRNATDRIANVDKVDSGNIDKLSIYLSALEFSRKGIISDELSIPEAKKMRTESENRQVMIGIVTEYVGGFKGLISDIHDELKKTETDTLKLVQQDNNTENNANCVR